MVGGTTPPQSDSGEISRVLVLNLLWQSKRCSRTAQDISVLTTPSLLSRATRRASEAKAGQSVCLNRSAEALRHPNSAATSFRKEREKDEPPARKSPPKQKIGRASCRERV